jgi:SAM-dependent methyltransferase
MFGPERHKNLADALPVPRGGAIIDLGCGKGETLAAIGARVDSTSRLVGLDIKPAEIALDRAELVIGDLDEPLPFPDDSFEAAVCQNVIECIRHRQAFLFEVARILKPGGHLLLGHTDYDTIVFSATDLDLTRRLVHSFCDTVQPWMTVADGAVGRRLVALARRGPLELVRTFAWVAHHTTFEPCGPAHSAATLVAKNAERDPELAPHVEAWLGDLERQAAAGEFFYSLNDYAVLMRKPLD